MKKLIEALQYMYQFLEYPDEDRTTSCEHDVFYVCDVNLKKMTAEDVHKLFELGFVPGTDEDYRYVEEQLGHDFAISGDWSVITEEQWQNVREYLTGAMWSYVYGSC